MRVSGWRNHAGQRLTALVLWVGALWMGGAMAATAPLTVRLTGEEYPPYMSQSLPYGGLLTRVVIEAFREAGVQVNMVFVPNNRAITGPMLGLYDGSFGWARSAEREKKLLYSRPIYTFRMVFFQRRDASYPWHKLADLAPYRIGVTRGNHYSDEFTELQQAGVLKVDEALDDIDNLRKLAANRVDLFPMDQEAGRFLLLNLPRADRDRIVFQRDAIWEVPLHVVIWRGHPHAAELVARFNRGYQALANSGRLKQLIEDTRKAFAERAASN